MRIVGYLNINDIQIVPQCQCSIYLHIDWTGVKLTSEIGYVMKFPSKVQISIWTYNDWKNIDSKEPY